jgi:hypothetical protein
MRGKSNALDANALDANALDAMKNQQRTIPWDRTSD